MDKLQTTILAGGRLDCKAILQRCGRSVTPAGSRNT